jgi:UDP-N-acetyl-D-glucosamine/UDP-N-acetyl-D-galactosamine dehydrogenase
MQFEKNKINISVIGLGYVGLPLAVEFSKLYSVVGFDINQIRIDELSSGHDRTQEIDVEILKANKTLKFSSNLEDIKASNIYIVTVPTPIDKFKKPDLRPLLSASKTVGKVLKKGDIVIYESTVYPGCTEEDCVPVLEQVSGLKFNIDFYCGYSPERINPGDKEHTVANIRKVTSGSTPEIAEYVDQLYLSIITAGTFKAASLRVAEAAKVIENCQRDINIAFVNELALIFQKMNIDTKSVLEAAGSKWNFLKFSPGLVGGHCIGVDPYYLTYKAESLGYNPQVILAGRRINDNMGKYVAGQLVKLLFKKDVTIKNASILVLGITFKENCPDIRNSRVIDIINELQDYQLNIDVYDPWADNKEVSHEYQIDLINSIDWNKYSGIVLAVSHYQFLEKQFLQELNNYRGVVYDVKGILEQNLVSERL